MEAASFNPAGLWAVGVPIYLDSAAQQEAIEAFSHYHQACLDIPSSL
jgi:hypothetical protein